MNSTIKPSSMDVTRHIIEKIRVDFLAQVGRNVAMDLDIYRLAEVVSSQIRYQVSSYLASKSTKKEETSSRIVKTIKVPLTWWDHFKLRWAPQLFLKTWPIQYQTIDVTLEEKKFITITNVCPHINIPSDNQTHFEFLISDDPFEQFRKH